MGRPRFFTVLVSFVAALALWALIAPAPVAADPIPIPPEAEYCDPVQGEMALCLELPDSVDPEGEWPTTRTCAYRDVIRLVAWWYTGSGKAACVETTHWARFAMPSVCADHIPDEMPTACVGRSVPWDEDGDGVKDDTLHCVVWVAGSCWGFPEEG